MTDKTLEISLDQGTDEWHKFRRRHRMASVAAIPMGCAPSYWAINTPDLLRQYNDGKDFPPSDFARYLFAEAHDAEDRTRSAMSEPHCEHDYQPMVLARGRYAASLDGYEQNERKLWLEVKMVNSPKSATWKAAGADKILPHHFWQLVHQAYCLPEKAEGVHFVVTTRDDERRHLYRSRDELMAHWPKLKTAWEVFAKLRSRRKP